MIVKTSDRPAPKLAEPHSVASLQALQCRAADEKAAAEAAAVSRLDKRQLRQTCRTTLQLDLELEFDKAANKCSVLVPLSVVNPTC